MKYKIWIYQLISALFAFVLAVSSVGNLITGYELPVDAMWKICLWCAFAAIAVAVLFQIPHGGKFMIGLTAVAVFGLCLAELFQPNIQEQTETLLYRISSHYHKAYNWPLLGARSTRDVSIPLILWAVLVAFCVNWYICRRKHILVAIIPAVVPLALCLLTADKAPDAVYLYLLILGLAILLITDWTRRKQPDQSVKLTLLLILPIILAFSLLFICNPKESYVNRAGKIQKELSIWFEEVQDIAVSLITGTPIDDSGNKRVNLQAVGSKNTSSRSVMRVNSPIDGKLYLRERDYDVYTGTTWESTTARKENFTSGATANSVGTLTIVTYSTRSTLFVPYYATSEIELAGGALENEDDLDQYWYTLSQKIAQKTSLPGAQYKDLPTETKAWATKLVKEITAGCKTRQEKILKIQNYVRDSASYDTTAVRMGSSHTDFARWFLEECETGYCIHYATAATVLLRAAGIPARYVEGYAVNCKAGTNLVVRKQDAHAWVEYYDMTTRAWCILEATPGHGEPEKPDAAPGTPPVGVIPGEPDEIPGEDIPVEDIPGEDIPEGELPEEELPEEDIPEEDIPEEELPTEDIPTNPTTIPEETEPPAASAKSPMSRNGGTKSWNLRKWIMIALGVILFVLGIWLQGCVRIFRKRKLWKRGVPNGCTIWRWRQTRSLAKRLKQQYPEELNGLALKARFSQHEIQPDELQKYEDYRLTLVNLITQKPWYQRLFFKWILAIDCK